MSKLVKCGNGSCGLETAFSNWKWTPGPLPGIHKYHCPQCGYDNFSEVFNPDGQRKEPATVLEEAQRLVYGARQAAYGHPLDDYTKTVEAFNSLTGHSLTAEQGVMFMILVKLSRECHAPKRDNRVDGAGYFGCLDRIVTEREKRGAAAGANPKP